MEWTLHEIHDLHERLQNKETLNSIAKDLNRSRNAVIQAAKKIMFQQLLYHDPSQVAANYALTMDDMRNIIVDKKYYIPVTKCDIPQSVYLFLAVLLTAGIARWGHVLSANGWLMA